MLCKRHLLTLAIIFLSQTLPIRHSICQLVGTDHGLAFSRQIIQTVISRACIRPSCPSSLQDATN